MNPNLDVANSEAWVAVDADHAVRLEIPAIEGRYFTVQVIDQWGETITNINPRKFPLGSSGEFFFVAPDNQASLPNDSSVIVLRSQKAKILARIEIADDAETASELQLELQLDAPENIEILPPISVPDFGNDTLIGIEIFDYAEDLVAGMPDVSPRAAELQVLVQRVAALARDQSWRQDAEHSLRNEIIPDFLKFAMTEAGVVQNGWFGTIVIGVYGEHVDIRTAANLIGIWANVSSEVIYFVATRDSAGEPFDGDATYLLDFAPDTQPQHVVDAYWSLSLVDFPNFVAVQNRLDRFSFNGVTPPPTDSDGHLRIYIGPDEGAMAETGVQVPDANLLPSPKGGSFSLTFRTYLPHSVVREGGWFPPAVVKVRDGE